MTIWWRTLLYGRQGILARRHALHYFEMVTNVSFMTVSCLRFKFGLKSFKPPRKQWLNEAMESKRLAFVKQHEIWKAGDWSKAIFSDHLLLTVRRSDNRFDVKYTFQIMNYETSINPDDFKHYVQFWNRWPLLLAPTPR